MKKLAILATLMLLATIGVAQEYVTKAPEWFKKPPKIEGKYVAVGKNWSARESIAEDKARMAALAHIANQINPPKQSWFSKIFRRGNRTERVTTTKTTNEATLKNTRTIKKAVQQENGGFTVYLLVTSDREK